MQAIAESETAVQPDSASPSAIASKQYSKKELQDWADEKLQQWMDDINEGWENVVMDIDKPKDFLKWYPTDPHGHIESVIAPAYGKLVVALEPYPWESSPEADLAYVGSNMMLRIGEHADEMKVITVVTQDGKHEYVATREQWTPTTD